MTTKKQLASFATTLIKEISKSDKKVKVDFGKERIFIWFFHKKTVEHMGLYSFSTLRENKQSFKKAILKIRGDL